MKVTQVLDLFLSVCRVSDAHSHLVARDDGNDNHQPDSQTIASYQKSGTCMYYYNSQQPNWNKGLFPCIKYCEDNGGHGYTECDLSGYNDIDIENNHGFPKYVDDDGYPWVPAHCKCENEAVEWLAGEIVEVVVEMLQHLDNIICAIFLSAIQTIADIGLDFIPGKIALKGTEDVIRYAKSAYENGMTGANYYTNWVGDTCDVSGWNFDLESMFMDMVFAPDSMMGDGVSSTGCVLKSKDKSKCRDRRSEPDPMTSSKIHKGTSTTTKHKPTTTQDTTTKTQYPPTMTGGDDKPTTTITSKTTSTTSMST
ncbi:hypothetical protein E0Z10_g10385 [Xylaria hypoxylon]|uniref:Uncharacterized protein n=1 Tax=Xylaria hypoxylon TaxID=37992 RepID=A0A4Z0Y674_9PEZI|nr:hypothetical protein E0Z10_g10385 [Xylaria hypoxylon]